MLRTTQLYIQTGIPDFLHFFMEKLLLLLLLLLLLGSVKRKS